MPSCYEHGHEVIIGKLWKAVYHLFGDPKFGRFVTLAPASARPLFAPLPEPEGPQEVDVFIPDFDITRSGGLDHYWRRNLKKNVIVIWS